MKCRFCGKVVNGRGLKYCVGTDCKEKNNQLSTTRLENIIASKPRKSQLTDKILEASKLGMSYGEYVAMELREKARIKL